MQASNRESPSAGHKPVSEPRAKTAFSASKPLCRIGGAAALIAAALFVIEIIGVIATGPPPLTVIGWFTLLQHDRLRGLFDLFFLDMVVTALLVPLFLALYAVLRRASPYLMALATILGFVGIALYFASNTAFTMVSLSDHYAAATTGAQRSVLLAAGQAALTGLATTQGKGLQVSFALNAIAGLIISVVMLRSTIFSKVTAAVGIVGNVLEFGVPGVSVPFAVEFAIVGIGGVLLVIWYILIGWRLFQLARGISKVEANELVPVNEYESHRA
jgi:hypothetical protein